jgi:hypothetical protein
MTAALPRPFADAWAILLDTTPMREADGPPMTWSNQSDAASDALRALRTFGTGAQSASAVTAVELPPQVLDAAVDRQGGRRRYRPSLRRPASANRRLLTAS